MVFSTTADAAGDWVAYVPAYAWLQGSQAVGATAVNLSGNSSAAISHTVSVAQIQQQVNTHSAGSQEQPSVTSLSDGGWVVTWSDYGTDVDGSGSGIYQQRYDASGNASGGETLVNTYTADHQRYVSVAALSGGGWVVAWEDEFQDGGGNGIYQQYYASDGSAVGNETRVNSNVVGNQRGPSVTALSDGGWVVTWESASQDGSYKGIYLQRYDSANNAVGSETLVNAYTTNDQLQSSVTALSDGGWVVTWSDYGLETDGCIAQQSYDAAGNAVGGISQLFTGSGGAQSFTGGGSDDTFSVPDALFAGIIGNSGTDTLSLSGAGITLDFASGAIAAGTTVKGIEMIDLHGSGVNTLKVSMQNVLDMSATTDNLMVVGGADDTVEAGGFALSGTTSSGGPDF